MAQYNKATLLSQLVATDPAETESANKLAASIRQLKDMLVTFLAVAHDDNGTLKDGAVDGSGVLATGSVSGSSSNSGSADGKITGGTVSTPDLRDEAVQGAKLKDAAVTTAKLATDAVTTVKITDANVTAAKLANDAVTTAKILDANVTAAKLAADSVITAKILDANVTNAKLAAAAVTPSKFSNIGSAKIVCGDGSSAVAATVGGILTATYSVIAGVPTIEFSTATGGASSTNYARVQHKVSSGSSGGAATGGAWDRRAAMQVVEGTVVTVHSTNRIRFANTGTYLVRGYSVAYSCGMHKAKVMQILPVPDADLLIGSTAGSPAGAQTASFFSGVINIATANSDIVVEHYTELAKATNGLGAPLSVASQDEIYCELEIIRIT